MDWVIREALALLQHWRVDVSKSSKGYSDTSTAAHTPLIKTWPMARTVACGIIDEPNALNCLCVSPAYGSTFCRNTIYFAQLFA